MRPVLEGVLLEQPQIGHAAPQAVGPRSTRPIRGEEQPLATLRVDLDLGPEVLDLDVPFTCLPVEAEVPRVPNLEPRYQPRRWILGVLGCPADLAEPDAEQHAPGEQETKLVLRERVIEILLDVERLERRPFLGSEAGKELALATEQRVSSRVEHRGCAVVRENSLTEQRGSNEVARFGRDVGATDLVWRPVDELADARLVVELSIKIWRTRRELH